MLHNATPDWTKYLTKAAGIIAEVGGKLSHAALIAKENKIPCLVGVTGAVEFFKQFEGQQVILDATNRVVYRLAGLVERGVSREQDDEPSLIGKHTKVGEIFEEGDKKYAQVLDAQDEKKVLKEKLELTPVSDFKQYTNILRGISFTEIWDVSHKRILNNFLRLFETSPPSICTFSASVRDLLGFSTSRNNLIAFYQGFTEKNKSIALLHEIGHFLLGDNLQQPRLLRLQLEENNIIAIEIRANESQPFRPLGRLVLTRPDAKNQVSKGLDNPQYLSHYLLRALQREILGEIDVEFTREIKEIQSRQKELAGLTVGEFKIEPTADFQETKASLVVPPQERERRISLANTVRNSIAAFVKQDARVLIHGSVGRQTDLPGEFDIDILTLVKRTDFQPEKAEGIGRNIIANLTKELQGNGYKLTEIKQRVHNSSQWLISGTIIDAAGQAVTKLEITLEKEKEVYADLFTKQMQQIENRSGVEGRNSVITDILLMKYLLQEVVDAYKWYEQGLSGIGAEQLVIQSGGSVNQGREILGLGSFDKAMRWIYAQGYDSETQNVRALSTVTKNFFIYNVDGTNFLGNLSEQTWRRLVHAARVYVEGKQEEKIFTNADDLRYTLKDALQYRKDFRVVVSLEFGGDVQKMTLDLFNNGVYGKVEYERVGPERYHLYLQYFIGKERYLLNALEKKNARNIMIEVKKDEDALAQQKQLVVAQPSYASAVTAYSTANEIKAALGEYFIFHPEGWPVRVKGDYNLPESELQRLIGSLLAADKRTQWVAAQTIMLLNLNGDGNLRSKLYTLLPEAQRGILNRIPVSERVAIEILNPTDKERASSGWFVIRGNG